MTHGVAPDRVAGVDEDKTQVGGDHMAESQPGAQKGSALHWLDTRGSILATIRRSDVQRRLSCVPPSNAHLKPGIIPLWWS